MIEILTFAIGKPDYDKEYTIYLDDGICYAQILNSKGHLSNKVIPESEYDSKIKPF